MAFSLRALAPTGLVIALLTGAAAAHPVEFVVLGDMPYGEDQIKSLDYIGSQIRDHDYPFVIHYGDTKSGDTPCSDDLLTKHRDVILALQPGAVFVTPGDNDWTDCDRPKAGGHDELERLRFFRQLYYGGDLPEDHGWTVARQRPDYPEKARWAHGGLIFATLHVVGTDNGRTEIEHSDEQTALDAVDARDAATLAWVDAVFDAAEQSDAAGLVLAMQADPADFSDRAARDRACSATQRTACNPYLTLLQRLTARAEAFDKPVLLVHGSTNNYCLDSGYGGWRAPKLARLNGPGDFVAIDGAVVRFDPDDPEPFRVRGVLTGDVPPPCSLHERLN